MTQNQFYPLSPATALKLIAAKLTAAEWRIWAYLVSLDPFGDRYVDLETFEVMQTCNCSKATFYRAIAKFQKLELFDFQDKGFNFKNQTGASRLTKDYRKNETSVSKMRQDSQKCDKRLKNETSVSKMRQDSQKCENQAPEPAPDKDSEASQTIQTYTDFFRSLSDPVREKFFNFVEEKISQFPTPINDVQGWLAGKNEAGISRWRVYYEMFQKQYKDQLEAIAPSQDWEKHPHYKEWIEALRTYPIAFMHKDFVDGTSGYMAFPGKKEERQAFKKWAEANNKIWGEES